MKIFSCVYRVRQRYGSNVIADILKGSKSKKIINAGLNELSTYGIMKEYSKKTILEIINKLAADGYLNITNNKYPLIRLSPKSVNVLKNKLKVFIKIAKVKERKEHDNALFAMLKEVRKNIAKEAGVPPYIIFADSTLREMSLKLPLDKEEFLEIKGVGEVKFKRYGEYFRNVISEYMKENNISKSNILENESTVLKSRTTLKNTKVPSHYITYDMYKSGMTLEEISEKRNITLRTVEDHLVKCLIDGKELDINEFIPREYIKPIKDAIEEIGAYKLKPIKEALPEEVKYFWIKLIIANIPQG